MGGLVAIVVVVVWDKKLRHYFKDQEKKEPNGDKDELTQHLMTVTVDDKTRTVEYAPHNASRSQGGSRPSSAGGSRYGNGGSSDTNFGRGSSLSISFAKPGIYY